MALAKHNFSPQSRTALKLWPGRTKEVTAAEKIILKRHSIQQKGNKKFGLICTRDLSSYGKPAEEWVFFPHPRNLAAFEKAAQTTREDGPSRTYPGSVGSIRVSKDPFYYLKDSNCWEIEYIQGHFIQKKSSDLPRKLATEYGGWKHRLLGEIFEEARAAKVKLVIGQIQTSLRISDFGEYRTKKLPELIQNAKQEAKQKASANRNLKIFIEVAQKLGTRIEFEQVPAMPHQFAIVAYPKGV